MATMVSWCGLVVLCFAIGLMGCSSTAELCEKRAECEHLSDLELEECITNDDTASDVAASYDCSDEFDASFDCWLSQAECKDSVYTVPQGACDAEDVAYQECISKASTF